jgi:hypothetical protein
LKTRETVPSATPAALATSVIVARGGEGGMGWGEDLRKRLAVLFQ